jgi:prepilin-type N-terminal cleavage/methylation domain-containing protein
LQTFKAKRKGFTLIELLVVTGIIALLISILIPVVQSARETSNRAGCLANLHTLGECLIMYAQANRGCFPNDKVPGPWWTYQSGDNALVNFNDQFVRSPKLFYCPSDKGGNTIPTTIVTAELDKPNSARTSYDFYSIYFPYDQAPTMTRLRGLGPLVWDIDGGISRGTSAYRNHKAFGGNVVFADVHAVWVPAPKANVTPPSNATDVWPSTNEPPYYNTYYP